MATGVGLTGGVYAHRAPDLDLEADRSEQGEGVRRGRTMTRWAAVAVDLAGVGCAVLLTAGCGSSVAAPAAATSTAAGVRGDAGAASPPAGVAWSADGVITPGEYADMRTYLGAFEVHWGSDGASIRVGLRAETEGWVAVAFGPETRMKNADMVFGYVEDGVAVISDQFSTGDYGPHRPDEELGGTTDVVVYGGVESGGFTTIEFERALRTGDEYDKELSPGRNEILVAFGPSDSLDVKHALKGRGEIDLR